MMNNISIFYLNEVFIRKRHIQERGFFPGYAILPVLQDRFLLQDM